MNTDSDSRTDVRASGALCLSHPAVTTRSLRKRLHRTGRAPSVPSRPSVKKVWSDSDLAQYADLNRRRGRCVAMPEVYDRTPRFRLGGRAGLRRTLKRNVLLYGPRPVRAHRVSTVRLLNMPSCTCGVFLFPASSVHINT